MKYRFNIISQSSRARPGGNRSGSSVTDNRAQIGVRGLSGKSAFCFIEVLTALAILTLISFSVAVVINRCLVSATNTTLKIQAFEVARENMEKLLSESTTTEMVEYGSSEKYPAVRWQTTVETFYEPVTSRIWLRAICGAEYADANDTEQKVELTHWLTSLTKKELQKLYEQRRLAELGLTGQDQPTDQPTDPDAPEPIEEQEPQWPEDPEWWLALTIDEAMDILPQIKSRKYWELWATYCLPRILSSKMR